MTDASKLATLAATAQDDTLAQEPFTIADAAVADGAIALAGGKVCYFSGEEVVLTFDATRAGSAALVAGTPIALCTLVTALRPAFAIKSRECVCETAANTFVAGAISIGTDGVVSFTPHAAAGAAAGMVFHAFAVRVGPPASKISDDVV